MMKILEEVISVRMDKDDVEKLRKMAEKKGLRLSQFVRMILRDFLEVNQ
ncbi:MAG: ribbon-helix-helix protein, CopG family [Candidatus Methanospirareceae archaeon]